MPSRLELADDLEHLADQLGVERARDLVEQQRARPRGQRADDRDALLLAAREAVGVVALAPGQPEAGEQLARRAPRPPRAPTPCARTGASTTFSSTVRCGNRLNAWKTIPSRRRTGDRRDRGVGDRPRRRAGRRRRRSPRAGRCSAAASTCPSPTRRSARPPVLGTARSMPRSTSRVAVRLGDAADLERPAPSSPTACAGRCMRSRIRASGIVTHRYSSAAATQRRVVEVRRDASICADPERLQRPEDRDQRDVLLQRDEVVEQRRQHAAHRLRAARRSASPGRR